jgi:hypothetical protein
MLECHPTEQWQEFTILSRARLLVSQSRPASMMACARRGGLEKQAAPGGKTGLRPITDLTFYSAIRSHSKPAPIGLRMKPIRPRTILCH